MMVDASRRSIIVVGAGIVGASAALALQRDGHEVLLLDREGPAAGASFGNAGGIVDGSCAPTAMPGLMFDVLKMIGRPLSPLTIRPAYLPSLLPWLSRFLLESGRGRVLRNAMNLYSLSSRANAGWRSLTDNTPLAGMLKEGGWLKVYESERAFAATAHARYLMDQTGTPYEELDASSIRDLEPELAPIFSRGIFQRGSLRVVNPGRMVEEMVALFVSRGGRYETFEVRRVDAGGQRVTVHGVSDRRQADAAVIAVGPWSGQLAKQQGDRVPLESERGYHLMLPLSSSGKLQRPVLNGERSFVLAPMEMGLRLTSQVELAGLSAAPDYRRVRSLLTEVDRMLPGIELREESVWMGRRPSLPDSLPVLGRASSSRNIIYAFGHQHLGMTLGPATGLIVADLVAGRDPGMDLTPFRADRF